MISASTFAEVNLSLDLKSRYIWRGLDYGNAPSIQPGIEYAAGNFAIGTWSAFATVPNYDGGVNFREFDLYASYGFDFGLSLGITDYHYPNLGESFFEFSSGKSTHAFELNASQALSDFSVSANYLLNDAAPSNGSTAGTYYFELGYAYENISVFAGAGDGWHTADGSFQVSNIGLEVTKELKVTDSFSLGLNAAVILNPNTELMHFVAGISF